MAMVTQAQPIPPLPLPASGEIYRFTVDQFDRMVESGFLDEDDPVELLNGILVTKMPKNPAPPRRDEEDCAPPSKLCFRTAGLCKRRNRS